MFKKKKKLFPKDVFITVNIEGDFYKQSLEDIFNFPGGQCFRELFTDKKGYVRVNRIRNKKYNKMLVLFIVDFISYEKQFEQFDEKEEAQDLQGENTVKNSAELPYDKLYEIEDVKDIIVGLRAFFVAFASIISFYFISSPVLLFIFSVLRVYYIIRLGYILYKRFFNDDFFNFQ